MLRRVEPEESVPCPFGECDGSTWVLDEETGEARPCRCREQRVRDVVVGNIGAGLGRRFLEVSFEREPIASLEAHVIRGVRGFIRSLDANLSEGRGLWFDGPVGTGKTSLAILVAKAAHDSGRSYAFYPVPRLLAEIRQTYNQDATDSYLQLLRRIQSVDLLVLDDLGAEKPSEWVIEQLYSIVNDRWRDKRSIVVTSNVPEPDPESTVEVLRRAAGNLDDALRASAIARTDIGDARELLGHIHQALDRAEELDPAREFDPVVRLRRQIGARTVSRLVEICDGHIPILGSDLRMTAQRA